MIIGMSSVSFGESCFYQLTNKTIYNESIVSEIVSVTLSKYVQKVKSIPMSGVKSGGCFYSVSITPDFSVTLNGKKINEVGESELSDINAIRQSLLRAIYNGIPKKRQNLCKDFGDSALYYDCNPSKKKKRSVKYDEQSSTSIPNVKTTSSKPLLIKGGLTAFNAPNLNINQYYSIKGYPKKNDYYGNCHYEHLKFTVIDKNIYTFISSTSDRNTMKGGTSQKLTKDIGGKNIFYCKDVNCRHPIQNYNGEIYIQIYLCNKVTTTLMIKSEDNKKVVEKKTTRKKSNCAWNKLSAGMTGDEVRKIFGFNEKSLNKCNQWDKDYFLLFSNAWIWFVSGYSKGVIFADDWDGECSSTYRVGVEMERIVGDSGKNFNVVKKLNGNFNCK